MSTSIQGNDGFSQVRSSAAHKNRLTADNGFLNNLSVNALTITDTLINSRSGVRNTVVGYTPTNFSTLPATASMSFLIEKGRAQALDVNDVDLIRIPAGALIERLVVTTITGVVSSGATFTFGLSQVTNGVQSAVAGTALTHNTIPVASFATPGAGMIFGGVSNATSSAIGATATGTAAPTGGTSVLSAGGPNDNTLYVTTSAAVTAGALRAELTYINP